MIHGENYVDYSHGIRFVSRVAILDGAIVDLNTIVRDRNLAPLRAFPDLALGSGTWSWLEFAFTASAWLKTAPEVSRLTLPVVVLSAAQEALVDNDDQRQIVARIPKGRWQSIDGAFHELFQETDAVRNQVWAELGPLLDQWAPVSAG
jgi:lysophospholipase